MSRGHWGLGGLIAVGTGLRLWGIDFGLPHTLCRPDEAVLLHRALAVAGGDLNPHFFNYPSLHIYLLAASLGLSGALGLALGVYTGPADFILQYLRDPTAVFLTGRLLTAAMGSASVAVTYLAGRRVGGERAGLCSAGFLAVATLHVRDSHFATVDIPATFWILVAYALCWRFLDSGRWRDLWLSAAALGLAVSTKYNAALFAPALLAAPWLGPCLEPASRARRWRQASIAAACMAGAFLVTTPWVLLDPSAFWRDVLFEGSHFAAGHMVAQAGAGVAPGLASAAAEPDPGPGWVYHATVSLWYGPGWPVAVLGWGGVIWLARRRRPADLLLLAGAGAYFVIAGGGRSLFLRYALPLVPFLCIAAGALLNHLLRGQGGRAVFAATVLVAAPGAWAALQGDRLLALADTRLLAAEWIETRVPDGAVVALTGSEYGHPRLRRSTTWMSERLADLRRRGAPARRLSLELEWADRISGPRYYTLEVRPPGLTPMASVRPLGTLAQIRRAGAMWLVAIEHPLAYSSLEPALADELEALVPAVAFNPLAGGAAVRYDPIDAFYLPYTGLEAVARPGPAVRIYHLGDPSSRPPSARNPGGLEDGDDQFRVEAELE